MADRPTTHVDIDWRGGMKFDARDSNGQTVTVDVPGDEDKSIEGMMPGQLLLISLVACSGIDVVNILLRQRQIVNRPSIKIQGSQLPDPPLWTCLEFDLAYRVTRTDLNRSAVERTTHLSETKYCSIGATVTSHAKISNRFEIIEAPTFPEVSDA